MLFFRLLRTGKVTDLITNVCVLMLLCKIGSLTLVKTLLLLLYDVNVPCVDRRSFTVSTDTTTP